MNFDLRCDDVLILWLLMDFMAASWEVLASTFCTSHYESSRDQKCQSCGFRPFSASCAVWLSVAKKVVDPQFVLA